MIFRNFNMILRDRILPGSLEVIEGKITRFNPPIRPDDTIVEGHGRYLSPGFIDVHIHGAGKADTMDATIEALETISRAIVVHGTTSFLPTTMTMSLPDIHRAVNAVAKAQGQVTGAQIQGIHLEGPFISSKAIGAQNPAHVTAPSIGKFQEMVGDHEDLIRTITLAPELPGAEELIAYLREHGIHVSLGHTTATFAQAREGILWGATHGTHLFNAMTPFTHREPGVVGALFDSTLTTEIIADGIHVSYPALRAALSIIGADRMLLISDAMMACGMPDGTYELGGQKVHSIEGAVRLDSGALAGSVLTLDAAVRNVYQNTDLPLHEIVKMASYNGARFIGIDRNTGAIARGLDADLLILDEHLHVEAVYVKGMRKFG